MKLAYQRFRAPNGPQIQRTRGRPPGAMNQTQSQSSTRREPSLHEFVHRKCNAAKLGTTYEPVQNSKRAKTHESK